VREFVYTAPSSTGVDVIGSVRARDASDALAQLLDRGLRPHRVTPAPWRFALVSRGDQAIVVRSLAELVALGVPLDRALAATASVVEGPLQRGVSDARALVQEGVGLADALERARVGLPVVAIGLMRATERAGKLDEGLHGAALHLEQEAELRSRLIHAMAYPLLLLTAGLASLAVLIVIVIPRFAALLSDVGQGLPPLTRTLLTLSTAAADHAGAVVAALAVILVSVLAWSRTAAGQRRLHALLLATPYIGAIRVSLATARITRTLGSMTAAGIPLLEALDAARDAVGDAEIGARLDRVRDQIVSGVSISAAMRDHRVLSERALQLIALGDESGMIGTMALRAAALATTEADRRVKTAVTLIEPAMVIGFGGAIAFMAAALLQAIYALRPV
jgi:type II secretory pathway component PulF